MTQIIQYKTESVNHLTQKLTIGSQIKILFTHFLCSCTQTPRCPYVRLTLRDASQVRLLAVKHNVISRGSKGASGMIAPSWPNFFHYRPQRSCGQGNIFTGVCLSVQRGVCVCLVRGLSAPGGWVPGPGGVCSQGGLLWGVSAPGGSAPGVGGCLLLEGGAPQIFLKFFKIFKNFFKIFFFFDFFL